MDTVFTLFNEVEMEFLTVEQGTVYGNRVVDRKPIKGVFKTRNGRTFNQNAGLRTSSATVHVHPEDFEDVDGIVGNGIAYCGQEYVIQGVTVGTNFDNGNIEHLTLSLEVANYGGEGDD